MTEPIKSQIKTIKEVADKILEDYQKPTKGLGYNQYRIADVSYNLHLDGEETSIDDLVDRIDKQFIPPSHDTNGYEWEKCLKMMRDNLR
jgi:hypothetical protein